MHWDWQLCNLFEYYINHWKCKEGADHIGQRRVEVYCVVSSSSSSSSVIYYRTFYSHLKQFQLQGPVQSNESIFGVSIEVVWSIVISRLCRPTHKKRILPSDQGYFQTLFTWTDTTLQNIIPVRVISENSLRYRRWSLLYEYWNIKKRTDSKLQSHHGRTARRPKKQSLSISSPSLHQKVSWISRELGECLR